MKKIRKILICTVAVLLLLTTLLGCADKIGEFSVNEKIVCEADKIAITFDDYKYFFYRNYVSLYGDDFSDLSEEKYGKVKALTEDALKRRAYIYKLCDKYGIELSDKDETAIDDYVAMQIDNQGSEEKYRLWLLENRVTGKVFREQVGLTFYYDPYLRELLQTGIDGIVDMTPDAIVADVTGGNFYRYSQIYFSVGAGESDRSAYEKIMKAKEKLENGISFSDVASAAWATSYEEREKYRSEWGADVTKGVYVAKGEKELILEEAVLGLGEGEYSEPIWSGSGWHIFKRLPIDAEYVRANIDTQLAGEHSIADQSFARRYLEHISQASKSIEIEYAKYFTESVTFEILLQKETVK